MTTTEEWGELRKEAATRFKPETVRLLLVAEAPPSALERYFYFPAVQEHDSLFRYVVRLVLGDEPTRSGKFQHLDALRDAGVFLIDLCESPIRSKAELRDCVAGLVTRVGAIAPEHVILIKSTVFDVAYWPLRKAGFQVSEQKVPFPGSGQQRNFEVVMQYALDSIGWVPPMRAAR